MNEFAKTLVGPLTVGSLVIVYVALLFWGYRWWKDLQTSISYRRNKNLGGGEKMAVLFIAMIYFPLILGIVYLIGSFILWYIAWV